MIKRTGRMGEGQAQGSGEGGGRAGCSSVAFPLAFIPRMKCVSAKGQVPQSLEDATGQVTDVASETPA